MKRAPLMHPRVFDEAEFAESYARRHAKMGQRIGEKFAKGFSMLGFREGRMLDAGCGPGAATIELARAFPRAEVVGTDLSEPLLEIARSSAAKEGMSDRVSFERGNVEAMDFEDDSFDAVVSLNMLHIVEDPVAMLDEIERVMAPRGYFILGDIRRSWIGHLMPVFKTALTLDEGRELVKRSRLRQPQEFTGGFLWWGIGVGAPKEPR